MNRQSLTRNSDRLFRSSMAPPERLVPESIPGEHVTDPIKRDHLREHLAELCRLGAKRCVLQFNTVDILQRCAIRFPGSQPVSFDFRSLDLLEREEYAFSTGLQAIHSTFSPAFGSAKSRTAFESSCLSSRLVMRHKKSISCVCCASMLPQKIPADATKVDRKEDYYQNFGITFPHQDGPEYNQKNTVLDGELVIDVDRHTGRVCRETLSSSSPCLICFAAFPSFPCFRLPRLGRREPHAKTADKQICGMCSLPPFLVGSTILTGVAVETGRICHSSTP
jgi:hypothetical protein